MNSLTYRSRLKKDLWPKFRLGPKVRTKDRHNPESASKITADPRSAVFSKSANPLDLPHKATIRALLKAKFVDPKTYSPPSYMNNENLGLFKRLNNSYFSRGVRKKLKLEILTFYLHQAKSFSNIYQSCFQLIGPLCFENRTRFFSQCVTSAVFLGNMFIRARKYRFAVCFRVLSHQYVGRSVHANVFEFKRENKVNSRPRLFEKRIALSTG